MRVASSYDTDFTPSSKLIREGFGPSASLPWGLSLGFKGDHGAGKVDHSVVTGYLAMLFALARPAMAPAPPSGFGDGCRGDAGAWRVSVGSHSRVLEVRNGTSIARARRCLRSNSFSTT